MEARAAPRAVHDVFALCRGLAQVDRAQYATGKFPATPGFAADSCLSDLSEFLSRAFPLSEPGHRQRGSAAQSGSRGPGAHERLCRSTLTSTAVSLKVSHTCI